MTFFYDLNKKLNQISEKQPQKKTLTEDVNKSEHDDIELSETDRLAELSGVSQAKPDFLDMDKDGDKEEPMKSAAKDNKGMSDKQAKYFGKKNEAIDVPSQDITEWKYGAKSEEDYQTKKKELQRIQMLPSTQSDPELQAELVRSMQGLQADAKDKGWLNVDEGLNDKHGSCFDRGGADYYYGRKPRPHKGGVGGGSGPRIEELSPEEIADYMRGFDEAEKDGNQKQYDESVTEGHYKDPDGDDESAEDREDKKDNEKRRREEDAYQNKVDESSRILQLAGMAEPKGDEERKRQDEMQDNEEHFEYKKLRRSTGGYGEGIDVVGYKPAKRSSVLAGQMLAHFIDSYDTEEEALEAHPDAEGYTSKFTDPGPSLDHLPDENDPVPGGMYPDDIDDDEPDREPEWEAYKRDVRDYGEDKQIKEIAPIVAGTAAGSAVAAGAQALLNRLRNKDAAPTQVTLGTPAAAAPSGSVTDAIAKRNQGIERQAAELGFKSSVTPIKSPAEAPKPTVDEDAANKRADRIAKLADVLDTRQVGDTRKTRQGVVTVTAPGVETHRRSYDDVEDDDSDEIKEPRGRGRPRSKNPRQERITSRSWKHKRSPMTNELAVAKEDSDVCPHCGAEKDSKKVKETTSGAVATAPADAAPKSKKGGIKYGKGIYDSINLEVEEAIAESLNISTNVSTDADGKLTKSVSVNGDGEYADKLAQLLQSAGLHLSTTSDQVIDENSPENAPNPQTQDTDYMTNTSAGGINKPKRQLNPDAESVFNPLAAAQQGMGHQDTLNTGPGATVRESSDPETNTIYKEWEGNDMRRLLTRLDLVEDPEPAPAPAATPAAGGTGLRIPADAKLGPPVRDQGPGSRGKVDEDVIEQKSNQVKTLGNSLFQEYQAFQGDAK